MTSKYATHLGLYLVNRLDYDWVRVEEFVRDERQELDANDCRGEENFIHDQQGNVMAQTTRSSYVDR